jgi:hypothetical protein
MKYRRGTLVFVPSSPSGFNRTRKHPQNFLAGLKKQIIKNLDNPLIDSQKLAGRLG